VNWNELHTGGVPQSEKQEQPAKEGQKLLSLPLIKTKVLQWRRKPSKKPRLTAPAGESNDLLRMPPPPSKHYHAPTAHKLAEETPVLTGLERRGRVRRKEIKISRESTTCTTQG